MTGAAAEADGTGKPEGVGQPLAKAVGFRPLGRILKRTDTLLYTQAADYLAWAERHKQEIEAGLAARVEAARAQGFAQGLDEGRRAGAEVLAETAIRVRRILADLEADLVEIVIEASRRVIGTFEPGDALGRAVRVAIEERQDEHGLCLRVHPEARTAVAGHLAQLSVPVRIEIDGDLDPAEAVLDTSAGFVKCGIDRQLDAIRAAARSILGSDSGEIA
jgi:type III secretion system HrpE/YscL family protein